MKFITLLATLIITLSSCNCQKKKLENTTIAPVESEANTTKLVSQESDVPVIYYGATTRGYFISVKIENQKIYVTKNRDFKGNYGKGETVNDTDWKEIVTLVKKVDLDKVKDLKWPTEKRYYDGAAHADVTFVSNGVEYKSSGFDHGFPPAEIADLINLIVKLAEKTNTEKN
jgi:hypothetical protein